MFILILYLITMLIRPQDWVSWFIGFPTASILIPLGLIFGYAKYNSDPNKVVLPQSKLLVAYLFVIFLSTLIGTDFGNAIDIFITYLKRVLVFFMFFWLITTKEQLKLVITTILFLTMFVVYQAYQQTIYGEAIGGLIPYRDSVSQRSIWWGDWDGPNVASIMFLASVPFALEWVWGKVTFVKRIAGLIGVSLLFLGIYTTNSRGAMLTVCVVLLYNYRYRLLNPKIMVLAIVIGSLLLAVAPSRVTKISSKEDSASERTWLWEEGLKFFRASPVLGLGKDEFQKNAQLRLRAHSNYVQSFSELGLIGFFFYVAILWTTYRGNMRIVKKKEKIHPTVLSINRAMTHVMVAFGTVTFFVTFELDFLYMLLGICAAASAIGLKELPEKESMEITKFDLIVIAGSMFAIIAAVWLAAIVEIL